MDFDEAVRAHSDWKMKLAMYLRKRDGSFKPDEVCQDNRCVMGKWIHGEGRAAFGSRPSFGALRDKHARFHREAAEVVRCADAGQSVSEEVAIGANSAFARASAEVVDAVRKIKLEIAKV